MGDPPSQIDRINAGLNRLQRAIDERVAEDDMAALEALLLQNDIRVIGRPRSPERTTAPRRPARPSEPG